jgi:hypothetical protein
MDHSFDQQEFETQKTGGFTADRQVFESILEWLADLVLLTKEEQNQAGIYIGDHQE